MSKYTVTITEPTEYRERGYQTAAWWTDYELQPGTYEVETDQFGYNHFKCPGVVKQDFFGANFAGNFAGMPPYDRNKNAGRKDTVRVPFPGNFLLGPDSEYNKKYNTLSRYTTTNPTFEVKEHER